MAQPLAPPSIVLGKGRPLVVLHAFPLDGRLWMNQARALSDDYQAIVPDMRGFGAAAHQLGALDEIPIDLVADDIAALLDEKGIHKAVVGGISRGGYVALAFARRHPARLEALMLLDTRATPADGVEQQNWSETVDRLRREGIGFLPDQMKDRLFGATTLATKPQLFEDVRRMILDQDPKCVAAAARGMANRPDARQALPHIHVPVLTLAGVEDKAFADTRAISDAIPEARFVAIEGAGHLSMLEQSGVVTETIRQFLAGL